MPEVYFNIYLICGLEGDESKKAEKEEYQIYLQLLMTACKHNLFLNPAIRVRSNLTPMCLLEVLVFKILYHEF